EDLMGRGLVSNDRFDVIRRGAERGARSAEREPVSTLRVPRQALRPSRSARRAPRSSHPEGRWSTLSWGRPEAEARALFLATILLERFGIVARELAQMDPLLPPWRVLYEVLSRMELAGEVRRGYFVEGLSGAQFALPEAARLLQECGLPAPSAAP